MVVILNIPNFVGSIKGGVPRTDAPSSVSPTTVHPIYLRGLALALLVVMCAGITLLTTDIAPHMGFLEPESQSETAHKVSNTHFLNLFQGLYTTDDHGLAQALERPSTLVKSQSDNPKIAILFLVTDGHSQDDVWNAFFREADENLYNVYVHRSHPTAGGNFLQHLSGYHDVSTTSSEWCALMGVQYALLQTALRDPTNQQFVFVSHNSVPLKSFKYMYVDLVGHSSTTSKMCFTSTLGEVDSDCRFQGKASEFESSDTLKHHQWIILSREHAKVVLYEKGQSSLDDYSDLRMEVARKMNDPKMCSDETVPSLALIQKAKDVYGTISDDSSADEVFAGLQQYGVDQRCSTFVYWARCFSNSPFDLGENYEDSQEGLTHPLKLSGIEAEYLQMLVQQPSLLFARKFPKDSVVLVSNAKTGTTEPVPLAEVLLPLIHEEQAVFDPTNLNDNILTRLNAH